MAAKTAEALKALLERAYRWQREAFGRFVRAVYFALIVDCGCGKTLAAIMIALAKGLPVVVIAPGHRLCAQWAREIRKASGDEEVWVYDRNEEREGGEAYREKFEGWLSGEEESVRLDRKAG
jgi:superfamily II DNA or RNA helicase